MKRLAQMAVGIVLTAGLAFANMAEITTPELEAAVKAKTVTLVDCNGTASYQKGHIPGAIDFEANKAKLATLLPKSKGATIVAYCGGPKCNAYKQGAEAAQALGYTNVKHYTGGLEGWTGAKLALEK